MYCLNHIAQLGRNYQAFRDNGVQILAVGVSEIDAAVRITKTFELGYPVLADRDRVAYDAFGFGRFAYVLQRSGTVVIERGGIIRMLHRSLQPQKSLIREDLTRALASLGVAS